MTGFIEAARILNEPIHRTPLDFRSLRVAAIQHALREVPRSKPPRRGWTLAHAYPPFILTPSGLECPPGISLFTSPVHSGACQCLVLRPFRAGACFSVTLTRFILTTDYERDEGRA